MKRSKMIWIVLILAGILNSCSKSPVASFIYIPAFQLSTNYPSQGSASHAITDAWLYVDDNPVGVFELPASIPVNHSGNSKITVFPGIKKDGITATRIPYPFYAADSRNMDLVPSKVDTLHATSTYVDGLSFPMIEDFESGNDFSGMTAISGSTVVFEGNRSGRAILDDFTPSYSIASSKYILPGGGTRIFLELNYRNQQQFDIFARANHSGSTPDLLYLITITPKDTWHKVYVDLTSAVSSIAADNYQIVFKAELPDTVSSAEYYWDNIKIVHF